MARNAHVSESETWGTRHGLREFEGPVAIGLRSGHVGAGNVTLPLGVRVRMDLREAGQQLEFMEAAVVDC